MASTIIGTRCHMVAQVPIRTSPPATLAIEASISSSLSTSRSNGRCVQDTNALCAVKYFVTRGCVGPETLLTATERVRVVRSVASSWQDLYSATPFTDSTGAPASCHARQPPAIEATLRYPIF